MNKFLRPWALAMGLPMLLWQTAFFFGAAIILLMMTFWRIRNYRLVADWSLENWRAVFGSELFYSVYFRTIGYALLSATLASVLAFAFAYSLAFKVSPRLRRIALMMLVLPYFTSYLVRSYAWRFMLERDGIINFILSKSGFTPIEFQGSTTSLLIGYLAYFFPVVALVQLLGLTNLDKIYLEAANNLGASRMRTVTSVVIPLMRGPLAIGFSFAFMMALGDYVVPAFIGSGKPTLSILVVNSIQGQSNFPKASAIAVAMLVTLGLVFFIANALAANRKGRL